MILHLDTLRNLHEVHVHIFTVAVPDKVEIDHNVQTETVESKDQHVQAETRAQEQGLLPLGVKTASIGLLLYLNYENCKEYDSCSYLNSIFHIWIPTHH